MTFRCTIIILVITQIKLPALDEAKNKTKTQKTFVSDYQITNWPYVNPPTLTLLWQFEKQTNPSIMAWVTRILKHTAQNKKTPPYLPYFGEPCNRNPKIQLYTVPICRQYGCTAEYCMTDDHWIWETDLAIDCWYWYSKLELEICHSYHNDDDCVHESGAR